MRILTLLALTILLLNACGLKGPLYLPQEPAPAQPQKSQKSPDTEKKK
jgi:predicted small lipoprotein YifL